MKRRFRILICPPEIDMDLQARLPAALTAIHNFICMQDPEDMKRGFVSGELATGQPRRAERDQANVRRDAIASAMWVQYQAELQRRGDI